MLDLANYSAFLASKPGLRGENGVSGCMQSGGVGCMQSGGENGVQRVYAEWWCEWCAKGCAECGVGGV